MSKVLPLDMSARRTAQKLNPVIEPRAVRWLLTGIALLFLVVPLVAVFVQAFAKGIDFYFESLKDPMRGLRSSSRSR